jgi:AcrR family transcriptional regulator
MVRDLQEGWRLSRTGIRFIVTAMPKVTEEHRLARREQIVAAARRCAIDQGFHKTTMADVIRESGLSAGAVYSYFKSKDDLVAAIADSVLSGVGELFEKLLASEEPLTPTELLAAALGYVERVAGHADGDVTRVALQAWAEAMHNDAVLDIAQERYRFIRGHFVEAARRMQADGTIGADADPEHVGQALFAMVPGFILQRLILGDVTPDTFGSGLSAILR